MADTAAPKRTARARQPAVVAPAAPPATETPSAPAATEAGPGVTEGTMPPAAEAATPAASISAADVATPPRAEPADAGSDGGEGQSGGEGGDAGTVGEGETQAQGGRAAMATATAEQLEAQERKTLIGTIGEWAGSGVRELKRVLGLVREHDYSADELETFGGAFDDVQEAARSSAEELRARRDMARLQILDDGLAALGIPPGAVLSISDDLRTVVTTDGRKIELA